MPDLSVYLPNRRGAKILVIYNSANSYVSASFLKEVAIPDKEVQGKLLLYGQLAARYL
jgi:hypothetical protein